MAPRKKKATAGRAREGHKKPGMFGFLKDVINSWIDDRGPKMAAALAYYTAFAVAPLLLIAIAVAGMLFGQEAARGEVVHQISGLVGEKGAETIQDILSKAWNPNAGIIATVLGILAFLVAATGVFGELQDSLNQVWKVRKRQGRGILGTLEDRFLSMMMVLGMGFLLLVSLILTTGLEALSTRLVDWGGGGVVIHALSFVFSFMVVALLFSAIFKVLPDAHTRWRDTIIGGMVTAFLFTIGKYLIGLYLGKSSVATTYGAAGSFVIFLLWVNYSAQIVFLGAEFTKKYADRYGVAPTPDDDAVGIECAPSGVPRMT